MKHTLSLLILGLVLGGSAVAQSQDCSSGAQTFTSATSQAVPTNNRTTRCVSWVFSYYTDSATGVSVTVEGSPDNNGSPSGVWTALTPAPGPVTTTNPATGTDQGVLLLCCDYYAWIRVTVGTLTGAGAKLTIGGYGYKSTADVVGGGGGGGGALPVGGIGAIQLEATTNTFGGNNALLYGNLTALSTPTTPVITQGGTPGSTNYAYALVCKNTVGAVASLAGTTATGADTLNGTDFNTIAYSCPASCSAGCDVHRTVAGGSSPVTLGVINASPLTGAGTFDDTGLAGNGSYYGSAPPLINTTAGATVTDNLRVVGQGSFGEKAYPGLTFGFPANDFSYAANTGSQAKLIVAGDLDVTDPTQYIVPLTLFQAEFLSTNPFPYAYVIEANGVTPNGNQNYGGSAIGGVMNMIGNSEALGDLQGVQGYSIISGTSKIDGSIRGGYFAAQAWEDATFNPSDGQLMGAHAVASNRSSHKFPIGINFYSGRDQGSNPFALRYGLLIDDLTPEGDTAYSWYAKGTGSTSVNEGSTRSGLLIGFGSAPGISGCGATISADSTNAAGIITSGTSGSCTVAITMASSQTAPHGFSCSIANMTTPADIVQQTATSTASATFSGTTVSGDQLPYVCVGY